MGTEVRLRTSTASVHAIATPAKPPVAAKHEDSTRNWFRMSRRRAPSDLRMPISCVRSVTTASMMFMITMPPTTMNTDTMPTAMAAIVDVSRSQRVTKASDAKIEKLSSWPGPRCRYARISTRVSSCASAKCSWSMALAISRMPVCAP